jgi:hypothetical protein
VRTERRRERRDNGGSTLSTAVPVMRLRPGPDVLICLNTNLHSVALLVPDLRQFRCQTNGTARRPTYRDHGNRIGRQARDLRDDAPIREPRMLTQKGSAGRSVEAQIWLLGIKARIAAHLVNTAPKEHLESVSPLRCPMVQVGRFRWSLPELTIRIWSFCLF